MAIHVDRTLKELVEIANKLGITVTPSGKNGKYFKEDYIYPIREHFLKVQYHSEDKVPNHLKLMLHLKSPMLAKRIDALKPEKQKEIWEDEAWGFEEKLNGARMTIIKDGSGIHLYSRHNSAVDLLPIEYTDHIAYPENFDLDKIADNFILDVELTSDSANINTVMGKYGVQTETQLQAVTSILNCDPKKARLIQRQENLLFTFNSFDCMYYNGQWIMNEPLKKRREVAQEILTKLANAGFKILPVNFNRTNKRQFYKELILAGKEGAVAKHDNGIYVPDTNRQSDGWIKIKRSLGQMTSLNENVSMDEVFGDTIDGWISGFERGKADKGLGDYVGTIKVSVFIRKANEEVYEHEIAHISGFDMQLREELTERVNGIPMLKPSYFGRVVEIDGAGISPRVRRLNHAVLIGFRYDKSRMTCILDEDFLESQIL